MTASTWTWLGGNGSSTVAADWTGSGNINGIPQPGDVVIVPGGVVGDGLPDLSGEGSVTIQSGGTVSVTAAGDGINFGQTTATAGTITVTGTSALLTVAGGTHGVIIGNAGTGALFVQNGGKVVAGPQSSAAIDIGVSSTGTGAVTVSDLGSSLGVTGQLDVGSSGSGSLTIENQGTVISGGSTLAPSQGVDLGVLAGGSGTLSVTGNNSLFKNTGGFIVGDTGVASLAIGSGGTVSSSPGTVVGLAGLVIANTASASGSSVTLTGTQTNLRLNGLLDVGAAGSGSLQLSGGATATAGSLDAGVAGTGVGQIGLTGTGTSLTLLGSAIVGDASANALLSVLAGATFAATSLTIGAQNGSLGNVNVSGQGSLIKLSGALNIGSVLGTGDLTVGTSSTVEANVVSLQSGQVIMEGGLLDPTVLLENPGSTTTGYGTLAANDIILEGTFLSNGSRLGQETLLVQGTLLGGGTLTINGTKSVDAAGILAIAAGDTMELSGPVLNAATTTFTDNLTPADTYTVNNSVVDVEFQAPTGELLLDDIAGFAGTIATYQAGDSFVITGGTLSSLGVINGNTLTVHDSGADASGTGGIDHIIFASAINPSTSTIQGGNTIVAGSVVAVSNTIVTGNTLEIVAGPYRLSGFSTPTSSLSNIIIDPGVDVTLVSDTFTGGTLTDQGQMVLNSSSATGGAVTIASTKGVTASGTVSGGVWSGITQLNVGAAGNGSFLVNNVGSAAAASVDIGTSGGGSGVITVSGTNSLLSNTGTFVVGDAGLGSLAVDAGGTVTTSANATIANSTSAAGSSANVTGGNFLVAGTLVDGNAGAGLLDIGPGGAVSALELDLGSLAGGAGVLTIDGPGASLNATNSLVVGVAGVGELSILDGASVTIGGDLDIGVGAGASGNVDIENTTGTTTINGGITLGAGGGVAVLTIGTLTDVVLNGGLFIGKHANLVKHTNFDPPPYLSNAGGDDEGSGVDSYKAYVQNTGAITQDQGGTLVLQTPTVYGAGGGFQINTGGSELDLNADGVSGQVFDFTDNTGTLVIGIDQLTTIDTPSSGTGPFTAEKNPNFGQLLIGGFGGTIAGMVAGDAVVVDTTAAAHISYAGGGSVVSVIDNAAGTQVGTLAFNSAALAAQIAVGSVSAKQLELVACFAAGTRIGTDRGPVAVESLQVGDAVTLAGGGAQTAVWIGSRTIDCARHPRPETVWPVCVARGAFGGNVPERALYLSPDHAVFVDGVLIPVKLLVNGTSITQMKRDHVTYYHVELPEHAVILAEGLAVESYLDTGDRYDFATDAGVIRLHPDFAARLAPNMARLWETRAAAPLVLSGTALEAVRQKLGGPRAPDVPRFDSMRSRTSAA